jgi:hypothetical protein
LASKASGYSAIGATSASSCSGFSNACSGCDGLVSVACAHTTPGVTIINANASRSFL